MFETIMMVLTSQVSKSFIEGLFKMLTRRSLQRALKDMIVDLCMDVQENTIEEAGGTQEEVKKLRRSSKRRVSKEVSVRLGALFKAFTK